MAVHIDWEWTEGPQDRQSKATPVKREIRASRIRIASASNSDLNSNGENVVQRLRRRIDEVRYAGIAVRADWLDGQQASWFELRGVHTIILDASQTAAEQLGQLDDILAEMSQSTGPSARSSQDRPFRAA